jgi:2-dehydro-3-deoxygalactonokinase
MPHTVFVDWGTTNFRAYLVADENTVVAAKSTAQGVRSIADRFEHVLGAHVRPWMQTHDITRICCAGMIGGDLGWHNVSLVPCPATIQDVAENIFSFDVSGLPEILIVPGLCSFGANERASMMRGEEVLLFGSLVSRDLAHGRFCFPGTHSKWVAVRDGAVRAIQTSMTGECFALLRTQSVLSHSLEGWSGEVSEDEFLIGVSTARTVRNPLQSAFSVRALHIQGRLVSAAARGSYLSGLLIGAEIAGIAADWEEGSRVLTIVCEPRLAGLYGLACRTFDIDVILLDESQCFVAGGSAILRRQLGRHRDG